MSAWRAEAVHMESQTIVVSGFFQAFRRPFVSSCCAKGLPPDQKTRRMSGYVIFVPLWSIVFPGLRKHSVKRASGIDTSDVPSHLRPVEPPFGFAEMPGRAGASEVAAPPFE